MGVFQNNLMGAAAAAASAGGGDFYSHQIANSCRLDGTGYLTDTRSSDGSTNHATVSIWFKRSKIGSYQYLLETRVDGNNYVRLTIKADDTIEFQGEVGASMIFELETTQVFRDTSAWYHFVGVIDFDNSTQADRAIIYINGERVTAFDTATYPSDASKTMVLNTSDAFRLGASGYDGSYDWNGYLAEVVVIDGTAQAVTDLGETKNGVWIPKDPSGLTFGTNGFYLKFESSSDLGNDSSGNNHDFALTNISTHDQMLDSPTFNSSSNGGNFATLNPLASLAGITFTEGNLKEVDNNSGWQSAWSTMAAKSGKFYFEAEYTTGSRDRGYIGVAQTKDLATYQDSYYAGQTNNSAGWYSANGSVYINTSTTGTTLNTYTTNDIVGCAIDIDNGYVYFSKNGTWEDSGNPASGSSGTGGFSLSNATSGDPWHLIVSNWGAQFIVNYGQEGTFAGETTAGGNSDTNGYGNFKYTVPSGYSALCTGALPIADAVDPAQTDDDYPQKLFTALAYSGDGGGSQTTGFQPDLVWVKRRNGSQSNGLFDSSRGTSKVLNSDSTSEEISSSGLTSFNSTGYTMGNFYNQSGNTYASWSWRANGGTTSTDSNGSVNSTVQADPSGSFSIVKFVGGISSAGTETIGHGLNKAPSFIINFCYDDLDGGDGNRWTRADGLTNWNYVLKLNATDDQIDKSGNGNMSAPTSTVFSINNTDILGAGSQKIISYCFANSDWIKSGKYEGNGNADGPFVYTGFRPALVVNKRIDSTGHWLVHDDARDTYNPSKEILLWSGGDAEFNSANDRVDFLSNGFKMRSSNTGINGSGNDYIYLAMAHNPFKYATAR